VISASDEAPRCSDRSSGGSSSLYDRIVLDLLAVGDVLLDVLLPDRPERHVEVVVRAGGAAVNAARTARRLGATAAVAGRVGDDAPGHGIARELERLGIDALLTFDPDRPTGTAVYRGGEIFAADRGANEAAAFEWLPAARATLVSAYLPRAAVQSALRSASGLRALDLQGISSESDGADVVLGPGLDLQAFGHVGVVCATHADEGAEARRGDEWARSAPPTILPGPIPGAGDAFAAGFLLALLRQEPLADALAAGCAAVTSEA